MTYEEFLAEAKRLTKPCRHYRFAEIGEPVSGYWHGVRDGDICVSVERGGKWLNVYLDNECESGRVDVSTEPIASSRPLYRFDAESLPPVDAVFRFGSPPVEKYIQECGWQRDWEFNNNFKGTVAHEYEREWAKQCPLYGGGVVAVEGGWAIPWPEGNWNDYLGSELVLWTFEESEPWVEVFWDGSKFSVLQRIT